MKSDKTTNKSNMPDEEFLDMLQKKSFWFFWNEINPETCLIRDRAGAFEDNLNCYMRNKSSIASVGFGITSICIAVERGWIKEKDGYERILRTLKTFRDGPVRDKNGFYYHFVDLDTGNRSVVGMLCELSSIDTALFIAGALYAGEYFKGSEVQEIADYLYRKINWPWMCFDNYFVNMGWFPPDDPREPFDRDWWNRYCEGILIYILAIGSPTYPLDPLSWKIMLRPKRKFKNYELTTIEWTPNCLFIHQYPQLWLDLRNKRDDFMNYFENSRQATLANRQFCIDHMKGGESPTFKTYGPDCWGLTAGDGPEGYSIYGSMPGMANHDGTVMPTASGGSIIFTPKESISCLRYMYNNYKDKIWGRYGFTDSFNWDRDFVNIDVIGIDQGAIILAIENHRTAMIWDKFMQIPYVLEGMKKVGFRGIK